MNRETFPSSAPVAGDISAAPGARQTTVVGIQTVPVNPVTPNQGDNLQFDGARWTPTPSTAVVFVNEQAASADYEIYINGFPLVTINGV